MPKSIGQNNFSSEKKKNIVNDTTYKSEILSLRNSSLELNC